MQWQHEAQARHHLYLTPIEEEAHVAKFMYLLRQLCSSFLSGVAIGFMYYCTLGAAKAAIDNYSESFHFSVFVNYFVP